MRSSLPAWLQPAPDSETAQVIARGGSRWGPYIHLLWSAWMLVTPLFADGYSWRWLAITAVSYPLFLWLFTRANLAPRRHVVRYALGMILLCTVLLRWYPSGLTYLVYGCIFLHGGRSVGLGRLAGEILLANALVMGLAFWIGYPWQALVWMPVCTLVIAIVIRYEESSREKDVALRLSHDEVRRLAAVAERERIGRDLHDLLGHTLSLVALKSDLAARLVERDPRAARVEMDEVSRVSREALAQVRRAVSGIRSAQLAAELASAKLLLETDGIAMDYRVDGTPLPPAVETAFAMVLREAVTNVQRHARARTVHIAVAAQDQALTLRIHDDGRGGALVPGNGLDGMRARVQALGGTLQVDSVRGHGTTVLAHVPCASPALAEDSTVAATVPPNQIAAPL